jgi:hypothetical protein
MMVFGISVENLVDFAAMVGSPELIKSSLNDCALIQGIFVG